MNRIDHILPAGREAKLRYMDADFQVLQEGEFVRCAVTNQPIRLDRLRYWSVALQEPYASAEIAFRRHIERMGVN
jgi:hypothetical protein